MKRNQGWRVVLALLATLGLLATACGGGSDDASPADEGASDAAVDATDDSDDDSSSTDADDDSDDSSSDDDDSTDTGADDGGSGETAEVSMWYHGAGNDTERELLTAVIDDFNAAQDACSVVREDFPQEAYNESVIAAALDGSLPDIIDVDGPVMPNWAWAEYMQPLTVPASAYADFLPGAIGAWNGEVYSLGLWDAAIAMFARKSVLEENGIRIPTLDDPWDFDEFDAALETLDATGDYDFAFDPGLAWTGEWFPYAFSPLMQSFGGDIIDRSTYGTAEDVINGEDAVAFGDWWQSLFDRDLAPGTSQDGADRDTGFVDGKYALQWNGNWAALAAIEAFGDDVVFLPAPDFGNGPKIGAASWQFGVSATSDQPECANQFIEFALADEYLAAFSDGIGLIPATPGAAALTENYAAGGPLEVFFELSNQQGTLRPPTPAYLNAAVAFEKALADIANGADVQGALDAAADEINADLDANNNYGN